MKICNYLKKNDDIKCFLVGPDDRKRQKKKEEMIV